MYDAPRTEQEWNAWLDAGVRIMPGNKRERLDLFAERGVHGWMRLPLIVNTSAEERELRDAVESIRDHPALALWQAPDEPIHHWSKYPREGGRPVREPWYLSSGERAEWRRQLEDVVVGMIRGAEIVRELDARPIWLNDTPLAHPECRERASTAAG